jgi:hypothetical protein
MSKQNNNMKRSGVPSAPSSSSTTTTNTSSAIQFRLSDIAYCKALLHAAKYPHADCAGFLLGKDESSSVVEITDCIPLTHLPVTSLSLQVGTLLVEEYCTEQQLRIVGCYFAPEVNSSSGPTEMMKRVASALTVKEKKGEMCLLVIQNDSLSTSDLNPFVCFILDDNKTWTKGQSRLILADAASATHFTSKLKKGQASLMMDIDDSMEDVSKDWRNVSVVSS